MINTVKKIKAEDGARGKYYFRHGAMEGSSGDYLNTDMKKGGGGRGGIQSNALWAAGRARAESWVGYAWFGASTSQ